SHHSPIYTFHSLSLHDALPILNAVVLVLNNCCQDCHAEVLAYHARRCRSDSHGNSESLRQIELIRKNLDLKGNLCLTFWDGEIQDRKSTRLNSSHVKISYAVFC